MTFFYFVLRVHVILNCLLLHQPQFSWLMSSAQKRKCLGERTEFVVLRNAHCMHTSLQRIARNGSNPFCYVVHGLLAAAAALRAMKPRVGQQPKDFLWRDRVSEEPALA